MSLSPKITLRRMARVLPLLLMLLLAPLFGCKPIPLGYFEVVSLDVIEPSPRGHSTEPFLEVQRLKIGLKSSTDLTEPREVSRINAVSDFCPLGTDQPRFLVSGPLIDGVEAGQIRGHREHPDDSFGPKLRPRAPGEPFRYEVILVTRNPFNGEKLGVSNLPLQPYDIEAAGQDVCVLLEAKSYFGSNSARSDVIRIKASDISAAFKRSRKP